MAKTDKSLIWFAVVNVFAASKNSEGRWTKAEALLKEFGVEYHSTRTGKAGNAREHTFDACMDGYRRFIAVAVTEQLMMCSMELPSMSSSIRPLATKYLFQISLFQ